MSNPKLYVKFIKFTHMRPNVVIQRNNQALPKTYQHISGASQWRLMDAVRNMANDRKLSFDDLSPDGDFEVSF